LTARLDAIAAPIRIGSRGSALALVQARWVADRLAEGGVPSEIVLIRTAGDDRAPDTAWGEGAFVSAIEAALLENRIDAAVHSAKDVPTEEDPRLAIAAWTVREDPRDALVCRVRGTTLATLPAGARVGTDSPRRGAFLRSIRPDLAIHPLSGNVDTRLRKLDAGDSDALVLAVAGLTRLGRADRIDEILPLEVAVPAPGQGALALQTRADDARTSRAFASLDDRRTRIAVEAERAFLAGTGGGCRSPIGALGTVDGEALTLRVAAERALALPNGATVLGGVVRLAGTAPSERGTELARDLAQRIVEARTRARVLVTRPAEAADRSITALESAGLAAVAVPTIEIRDEPPGGPLDSAIAQATASGSWLIATSPNGIRAALAAMARAGIAPMAAHWAVVGPASAALLASHGVNPFVPSRPLGESLVAELPLVPGGRALFIRGDLADPGLVADLGARGAAVAEVVGYRTIEGPESSRAALAVALTEPIDALAFASGSAVRGLLALAPADSLALLRSLPAICIGPTTAGVARSLGFATVREAADPAPAALVAAVTESLAATLPRALADEEPAPVPPPTLPTPSPIATAPGGTR
jgi:hydroxymethylbilane synthase